MEIQIDLAGIQAICPTVAEHEGVAVTRLVDIIATVLWSVVPSVSPVLVFAAFHSPSFSFFAGSAINKRISYITLKLNNYIGQ